MEEGQLLAWLKAPGDTVRKGEPLAEIEGDKTTVELEALADGVLEQQLVPAETTVPVGTVLARIRSGAGAAVSSAPAAPAPPVAKATAPPPPPPRRESVAAPSPAPRLRVAPALRRLAREHGIVLEELAASVPGGRVTRADYRSQDCRAVLCARSPG